MRPTEKIERSVKKMNFTAGAELQQRILDDALKARGQTETQPAYEKPNIWRTIMQSKMTKLAAAAVIVTAGLLGVHFLTGTNAYAQAVQEIKNARTVVFTLIKQANTGTGETIKVDVAYKEPGHLRTTTVDGYISIVDVTTLKMISIVPQGGYTFADINDLAKTNGGNGPSTIDSIAAMKALPAKADENLGEQEIDGIDCDGYRVTQGDLTTIIWLDAKNGDLVQVEHKYASAPGMNTIYKNIKFDTDLEDSLFNLEPPAGYKGVELKSNTANQTEEAFVNWLQFWANGNTDETFPPMIAGPELAKVCMEMAKQGKLKGEYWDKAEPSNMFNALLFVAFLPAESNWRYAGNSVKINTPDTPIFWYRPAGSENYRVIYADLTVHEMAEDQLPK